MSADSENETIAEDSASDSRVDPVMVTADPLQLAPAPDPQLSTAERIVNAIAGAVFGVADKAIYGFGAFVLMWLYVGRYAAHRYSTFGKMTGTLNRPSTQ